VPNPALQSRFNSCHIHQFMTEDDEILIECSCCHDLFDLEQMRMNENGKSVSCDKCRYSSVAQPGIEQRLDKALAGGSNPSTTTNL
jgi:hypothetical protein